MDIHWIHIVCVILYAYVPYSSESFLPSVPCADMFQYTYDGREWHGLAQIFALPIGQTTDTEITLSLPAQLSTQYAGSLDLYGTREAADQKIRSNQPVTYIVRFPLQSPIPKLTQISVNGQILCSGPPEIAPYVTTIRLEFILYTVYQREQQPVTDYYMNQQQEQHQLSEYQATPYQPSQYTNPQYQQLTPYQPSQYSQPQYQQLTPYQPTQYQPTQYQPTQYQPTQYQPTQDQPSQYQQLQYQPTQYQPSQYQLHPQPTKSIYDQQQQQQHPEVSYRLSEESQQSHSAICGKPLAYSSIESGIVQGSWPWLVAIYLKFPSHSFKCGGYLVSQRVVVAAAHCLLSDKRMMFTAKDIVLYLGHHNLNQMEEGVKMAEVDQLIVHSDYKSENVMSFDADVAVLVMKESVQYTQYIRPICLWEGSSVNEIVGKNATVVGWRSDLVKPNKIQIQIVSKEECLQVNQGNLRSDRTFCSRRPGGIGSCNKGSGMSIIAMGSHKFIGIWSYAKEFGGSNNCDVLNEYVVSTDIPQFVNWIKIFIMQYMEN